MKYKILMAIACTAIISCKKEVPKIVSQKGQIEMVVNRYYDPINNFEANSEHFLIGTINYNGNEIIEEVPEDAMSLGEFQNVFKYHISEDRKLFTLIDQEDFIFNNPDQPYFDIKQKPHGFSYDQAKLTDYENRVDIKDTLYNNRVFKRFYLFDKAKENLTSFEIMQTDTIYPYSANQQIENDYNGKISKIETYNKKENIYSTIYFLYKNDKFTEDVTEIFNYNNFIQNQKK